MMENNRPLFDLTTMLFVVFLVLKLTHQIDWSWWWVTSPLWIPVAAVVVVWLLVFAWATFMDYKIKNK